MENKHFYMVYLEGQNTPTFKHFSKEKAEKEAMRLTDQTGCTAYVLLAITKIRSAKYHIEDLVNQEEEGLPF